MTNMVECSNYPKTYIARCLSWRCGLIYEPTWCHAWTCWSVAIVEGFNHGLGGDYEEITLFDQWGEEPANRKRYLPAEIYSYLLMRFYDPYIYYIYN